MNADDPKKMGGTEGPEPVAERWTVPIWLIIVFALLFYWSQLFLANNAGGFSKDVYSPYHSFAAVDAANPQDPYAIMQARGRKIFETTCAACHQLNAMGQEGKAPPLSGSDWVNAPGANRIARIVLNGLTGPITVKGREWNENLTMLAWRDTYSDDDIAAVLTYVRSHFDNKAGPISPAVVKAARADKHPNYETSDELLRIPVE
jgi:mono/diheme cytochrome c family protein